MLTKAQERDALQRIAGMIADAGPDSYIGMAFAGCVEMARDNIENDFGNSMQERARSAERESEELRKQIAAQREEIARLREALATVAQAQREAAAAQIPAELYRRLWLAVEDRRAEAAEAMTRSADLLAELVDAPGDIAVKQGLKTLAKQKARREEAAALLADLEKFEPAAV